MSESLYCPKCNNYLMAGDGKCHDCPCGWMQSRDNENDEYWSAEVSALEDNIAQLQGRNRELADYASDIEADYDRVTQERDALREEVDRLLTDVEKWKALAQHAAQVAEVAQQRAGRGNRMAALSGSKEDQ